MEKRNGSLRSSWTLLRVSKTSLQHSRAASKISWFSNRPSLLSKTWVFVLGSDISLYWQEDGITVRVRRLHDSHSRQRSNLLDFRRMHLHDPAPFFLSHRFCPPQTRHRIRQDLPKCSRYHAGDLCRAQLRKCAGYSLYHGGKGFKG